MANSLMPVAPVGYAGTAPGFELDLKSVADRVPYTAGVVINAR